jgi:putative NADPH-quinone reductase
LVFVYPTWWGTMPAKYQNKVDHDSDLVYKHDLYTYRKEYL